MPCYLAALDGQLVKVEELTKTMESWDGSTLPPYKTGQPEVTVLKITVPPNTKLPWHVHPIINVGKLMVCLSKNQCENY
jgi:quercetin dioxygenase-like cupin family protein